MKKSAPLRPGELGFTVLLTAASLYAFSEAFAISGFKGLTTGGVMPMVASGIMVLSAVLILRDAVRRSKAWRPSVTSVIGFLFSWRLIAITALIVLFALAIPKIGFLAAAGVFQFVAMTLLWRGRVLVSAVITVASIAVIYILFRLIFQVILPQGSLWL